MIEGWHPEPVESRDVIGEGPVTALAGLFDQEPPSDELPVLWHWLFHLERVPQNALGPDGHPREGHFLPPIPDRRRMFAGARYREHAPIRLGDEIIRRSTLTSVQAKTGRTGELLFTTVRHEFFRDGMLLAEEEQDIVYRSGDAKPSDDPVVIPSPGGLTQVSPDELHLTADPVMLFRFSALTYNAHRIHYDFAYATGVEGHRGLVVHGPLLAILLAELPRRSGRRLTELEFRAKHPVFAGQQVSIKSTQSGTAVTGSGGDTVMQMTFGTDQPERAV